MQCVSSSSTFSSIDGSINAFLRCGLRYARSRAKKEGHTLATQRRRKDKSLAAIIAKRDSATPPVSVASSGSPSYSGGGGGGGGSSSSRRGAGYDGASYSSGGEGYGQHASNHGLDTLTPSPSPPSSSVNFVHYSPQAQGHGAPDGHQAYPPSAGGASGGGSGGAAGAGSSFSVPAQDGGGYRSEQVSPMLSAAGSPLTSTVAPASFERERDRERELPPTPVSAEPRHHPRRTLLANQRS